MDGKKRNLAGMACSMVEVGSAELWGERVTQGEATGQAASPSQRQRRAVLLVGRYLKGGVKDHGCCRAHQAVPIRGAVLSRGKARRGRPPQSRPVQGDLRGANMRGANLISADLNGAVLSGADMRDAHLSYADLRDAKLDGADLSDATVSEAELSVTASLKGAILPDGTVSR
jgi:hypothetical protein